MRALAILLLLLSVPTAAACSFAGPVPGPAKMTLVPDDGGEDRVIAIDGRMSGAGCELSNPHLLVDGTFVWLEYFFNPSRREVHLLDLATGEERMVELAHPDMDGFGYWNGSVVYRAHDFSDDLPPEDTFYLQRVGGGAPEALPFPPGYYASVSFDGPRVAAVRVEGSYGGPRSFYLYDMEARSWIAHAVPAQELVNASRLSVGPMGDGWLYLLVEQRAILYDVVNATPLERYDRATPRPPPMVYPRTIVDGYAYGWDPDGRGFQRMKLPDGDVEPLSFGVGAVGKVSGYTVYGDYSAPELDPWARFRPAMSAAPWVLGGAFVVLTPVVWLLRRRSA